MKTRLRFPVRTTCYLAALSLYIVDTHMFSGISWAGPLVKLIYLFSTMSTLLIPALLFISFAMDVLQKPRSFHAFVLPCMGLLALSALNTRNPLLLYTAGFMFCARGIRFDRILNTFYKTSLISLLILLACNFLGLTRSTYIDFVYGIANSLGFAHPNNAGIAVATTLLLWGCYNSHRSPLFLIAVFVPVSLLTFHLVLSRTSLILMLTGLLLILIYKLLQRLHTEWMIRITKIAIFIAFATSLTLMFVSDRFILNGAVVPTFFVRFTSALNLFRQHGLHLFGSYIEFRSTILARTLNLPAVVLDSAYLSLLLNHGLIPSILFVIAIVRISMVFSKTKNYLLLIMMALFMLGGMMEQYVLHVQTNFTLLALTSYVSPSVLAPNPLSSTQKKRRRNKIQI